MNDKSVKVVIFGSGVISGLLLILYLPVFILSPWWGTKGYYRSQELYGYMHFKEGELVFLIDPTTKYRLKQHDDFWEHRGIEFVYRLSFKHDLLVFNVTYQPDTSWAHNEQLNKITDPIIVWHILLKSFAD